jgi:hypothetical protein
MTVLTRIAFATMLGVVSAGVARAEPSVSLRILPFAAPSFPNYSTVVLPPSGYSSLDVILQSALAEIQPSTVRVTLNGMPMTPFVAVNPIPNGVRTVIKLGVSLSPDYSIRRDGESILTFVAVDTAGTKYEGQFYLSVRADVTEPKLAATAPQRGGRTVLAPAQHRPPNIEVLSSWPTRSTERTHTLEAVVTDEEGLRRVILEVNGRDVEEIVLQNEIPVRQQRGRAVRGASPGSVSGSGRIVRLKIPVRLDSNRINTVALRAESLTGLSVRVDQALEIVEKR